MTQRGGTLSGGEQQMLAIGRALMSRPRLLMLDEPSLGLAPLIARQIFDAIRTLNRQDGLTVLIVEQNANHALKLAHRGYVMVNGLITLAGTGKRVAAAPGNPRRLSGRRPKGVTHSPTVIPADAGAMRQDAANRPRICPKIADDFAAKSADNVAGFVPGPAGSFPKSIYPRGYLMKSLKLIGLALGASLALSTAALAQDISIAVAGPMTGGESAFGRQMKNGAEQAVADINAAGGVLGKKLALQIGDDACDPKQAQARWRKSSPAQKSRSSPDTFALRRRSRRRRPMPTATCCRLRRHRPIRCSPSASSGTWRASAAVTISRAWSPPSYIGKNYKGKNIAILNDKTTYGKGLADETKKSLNKAGITEKMFESYNKGDKDFTAIVSRLKRDNIDLVFVGGYHQEAGLILRQMRDQGMKTMLMAGDALDDKEFASITGPAGEGTLFTFGPDPRNKPTAKAIVAKFKAKNIDPEGYTLYTYAAMQVWTQAVEKANTTDAKKVMDTIKAGEWETVLGKLEFDAKGDIKQLDYVVYKWDAKGNYAELNPKGS